MRAVKKWLMAVIGFDWFGHGTWVAIGFNRFGHGSWVAIGFDRFGCCSIVLPASWVAKCVPSGCGLWLLLGSIGLVMVGIVHMI